MKKKIYICGPITHIPHGNRESFTQAKLVLEKLGYTAVNPHELFEGVDTGNYDWNDYMKTCIAEMLKCDIVVKLAGWVDSTGAKFESLIANTLKIRNEEWEYFIKQHPNAEELITKMMIERELGA
jgi:hypothetical protein